MRGKITVFALMIVSIIGLLSPVTTWGQRTLYVPSEYPTIQEAIDAAVFGDTVRVAAGTYTTNIYMKDGVSLVGDGPQVTIISPESPNDAIIFMDSVSAATKFSGFTITNGDPGIEIHASSPIIENCIITANGGGGLIIYGSSATIRFSTFSNNYHYYYGYQGSAISGINNGYSLIISNCTFSGQSKGAISLKGGSLTIDSCTFSGNQSDADGGAIATLGVNPLTISNSTFSGNNSSGNGAAMSVGYGQSVVKNSVFSGNISGDDGGAIAQFDGDLIITNCTFIGNVAPGDGGGGYSYLGQGVYTITNSIFWGNTPFDLIGNATYSNVGTGTTAGEGNISSDPLFVNQATGNYRLQASSPCIDAGNNAAPQIPPTDLDGKSRIADGNGDGLAIVDMGAYEFSSNTPSGNNVVVTLNDGIIVTFASVITSGDTIATTSSSGPTLPSGYNLGNPAIYYDIKTTASYYPPIIVCIVYDPQQFSNLNMLRLLHYENSTWTDVTTSNNTSDYRICGQVNSLSYFTVAMATTFYNFTGFYEPVENPPVINTVNAGRAVPVKFSLGGDYGLDIFSAGYPASSAITCGATEENAIEQTILAGGSSLSYDVFTNQYKYVWKTDRSWARTCRMLILKLKDGNSYRAYFKFK